jgi:hypothetical protein
VSVRTTRKSLSCFLRVRRLQREGHSIGTFAVVNRFSIFSFRFFRIVSNQSRSQPGLLSEPGRAAFQPLFSALVRAFATQPLSRRGGIHIHPRFKVNCFSPLFAVFSAIPCELQVNHAVKGRFRGLCACVSQPSWTEVFLKPSALADLQRKLLRRRANRGGS